MIDIPDFTSEPERQAWFIRNAQYFKIVRRANLKYYSVKASTLPIAEAIARHMVTLYPAAKFIIYAVHGVSDCWVCNILGKGLGTHAKTKTTTMRRDT